MDKKLQSEKKPYTPPKLIVYGKVKKLTNMSKRRRVQDGGNKRT